MLRYSGGFEHTAPHLQPYKIAERTLERVDDRPSDAPPEIELLERREVSPAQFFTATFAQYWYTTYPTDGELDEASYAGADTEQQEREIEEQSDDRWLLLQYRLTWPRTQKPFEILVRDLGELEEHRGTWIFLRDHWPSLDRPSELSQFVVEEADPALMISDESAWDLMQEKLETRQ